MLAFYFQDSCSNTDLSGIKYCFILLFKLHFKFWFIMKWFFLTLISVMDLNTVDSEVLREYYVYSTFWFFPLFFIEVILIYTIIYFVYTTLYFYFCGVEVCSLPKIQFPSTTIQLIPLPILPATLPLPLW